MRLSTTRTGAPASSSDDSALLLGLDIGSVNVKAVLLHPDGQPLGDAGRWCQPARGRPLAVVSSILEATRSTTGHQASLRLAATGAGKGLVTDSGGVAPVNEVVAVTAAVSAHHPEVRTIIDIGGQFTKWILVSRSNADGQGRVEDFALNGLCAAGSGAFLEQQAARLRLDLEELGRLAAGSPRGATIAGRCSVFAKSDMIHLQQRGTPMEEIAYGLCLALARTFTATVLKGRTVQGPVALVGGGAANRGLVRAFGQILGLSQGEIVVPADHLTAGAHGAALGSRSVVAQRADAWLEGLSQQPVEGRPVVASIEGGEARSELPVLRPPSADASDVPPEEPSLAELGLETGPVRAFLGVDVGSVSTNVVVVDEARRLLQGVYLPTRGAPVAVLDEALGRLQARFGERLEILGVGTTGSGRYLAEQLLGADLVKNEITAQLVSSAYYVPEVDSVFEIGGQDSKYIDATGGRLRDFEMNKICAAGTGSFLEEQADRLGVKIRGEFAELALAAERPRDLGTRCTVFMDAELVRAQAQGTPVEDICAGLAYSVARNYLEKVVHGRPMGQTVVFQGGTASNRAVVAAFEHLLGRPVRVHPYNRISGAIGMALLAARERDRTGAPSRFHGYESCREHTVRTFECQGCENCCEVSRVRAAGRVAHFGDVCEKYTARDRDRNRDAVRVEEIDAEAPTPDSEPTPVPSTLPDLFAERAEILEQFLPAARPPGRPRIGLTRATVGLELLPLMAHVVDQLGYEPVYSPPTTAQMFARGGQGLPPEVCLPLKVAAGHARYLLKQEGVERVLMPTMLRFPNSQPKDRPLTCLYEQALPDMVDVLESGRVLSPQTVLGEDSGAQLETATDWARCLEVSVATAAKALESGLARQRAFLDARRDIGRRILADGLPGGRGVVVLGKPYNLYDAFTNLNLARHLRRLGLFAIPMDLMPTDERPLDHSWYLLPWHFNRDQVRAIRCMESQPGLFPLLVSNFGCGPDAFTVKHLERLIGERPRLFLEFDEHRGEAGLITRLEAFADEIEESLRDRKHRPLRGRWSRVPPRDGIRQARRLFVPRVEGHCHAFAGVLRARGLDAEVLPPPDEETARLGEEYSSGRECHPWALLTGEMVRLARSGRMEPGDVFFAPGTRLPCLMPQYGDGWRAVREQIGESFEIWDPHVSEMKDLLGLYGVGTLFEGLTAIDYLIIIACQLRPREVVPGSVDRALQAGYRDVEETLARASRFNRYDPDGDLANCLARCMARFRDIPLRPATPRPIIGVTGDLYTRINAVGNGQLFERLEAMGCTVWPSPFFGATADFEAPQDVRRAANRAEVGSVLSSYTVGLLQQALGKRMLAAVDEELRPFCQEPHSSVLQNAATKYFGEDTLHLVRGIVGKMVDFANRGADGVIMAAGLNCMVGVAASAPIPEIRRDFGGLPMVYLAYGSHEGPAQRIQLETFVHQVHQHFQRRRANAS